MSSQFNVAIVGATGAVGQQMADILAQRNFPLAKVYPLASKRSIGKTISFGDQHIPVEDLETFDFSRVQIALFSAGGSVSAEFALKAASSGCVVVDNSSHFRYDDDVPLIITEVNPQKIADYKNRNIIANPNCSTMQLLVACKPLYDAAGISRINVATYQAVSGAGNLAIQELAEQSSTLLSGTAAEDLQHKVFPTRIAFNAIPHIDAFQDNGYTREEMKMVWETQKIIADDDILVNATAVRIPVFYGHGMAVHLETREKINAEEALLLLSEAAGVCVVNEHSDGGYPTQAEHAAGNDEVFVGRIRNDISHPLGLNLWIVSDNLRKGAALNAVQIAETLASQYL